MTMTMSTMLHVWVLPSCLRAQTHAPVSCSRAGGPAARSSSAMPTQRRNVSSANLYHLYPTTFFQQRQIKTDLNHVLPAMPNKNNIVQQGFQMSSHSRDYRGSSSMGNMLLVRCDCNWEKMPMKEHSNTTTNSMDRRAQ